MAQEYDVVILGGGTGGYVAAIRAAQLGLKTAIVEKAKLGGTCLHNGCIPSKALLKSAEVLRLAKESERYGVNTGDVSLDFSKVLQRKDAIVDQLHQGVQMLMKKGKIDVFEGHGRILGPSIFSPMPGTISVELTSGEENEILLLKHLIIATGSMPRTLAGLPVDEQQVLTSDGALRMETLPKSIVIIGGGVIGVEWASMLNDFGVNVTLLDSAERLLSSEDEDIANYVHNHLTKRGVTCISGATILPETFTSEDGSISVSYNVGDEQFTVSAEKLLVSIGREPVTDDIGLANTEIEVVNGAIRTNAAYQTKERHIYAIGDVIGGMQLAHVAAHEGILAVEHIAGLKREPLNYDLVPRCIYAHPESAAVGLSEKQAKERGYEIKVGKFPFSAVGKALVNGQAEGFVKVIVDKATDDLLGIHMIGAQVTDLISEAGLAMVLDAIPWEISSAVHPHPTLSEALSEAALAVDGIAIHM